MQDKHSVKCSFCDKVMNTTLSAIICPDCEKSIQLKNCPGCGQPVNFGETTKEHSRTWHSACYALFAIDETDEDYKDYDHSAKSKTHKTRKILTGNSTYLFYDLDSNTSPTDHFTKKGDATSKSSKKNERDDSSRMSLSPMPFAEDDEDFLLRTQTDGDNNASRPNFFSTSERVTRFVKDNVCDGKIYQNSITGKEFVDFLLTRKQCEKREQACIIGQRFINLHILVPVYLNEEDQDLEETIAFEGENELYFVEDSIGGMFAILVAIIYSDEGEDTPTVVSPPKEHNKMLQMTGYLYMQNKEGKERLWYELTAGILRSYSAPQGLRQGNEGNDSNCIEALDTQEFTVIPIHKANEETTSFKLVGTVREFIFKAESAQECEEWMSVLRNKE